MSKKKVVLTEDQRKRNAEILARLEEERSRLVEETRALQLQERRSTPAPEAIASIESAVRLLTHCSKSIRDGRPLPVELRQLDRTAMQLLGK